MNAVFEEYDDQSDDLKDDEPHADRSDGMSPSESAVELPPCTDDARPERSADTSEHEQGGRSQAKLGNEDSAGGGAAGGLSRLFLIARRKYAAFKGMQLDEVTNDMILHSSAALQGWADARVDVG